MNHGCWTHDDKVNHGLLNPCEKNDESLYTGTEEVTSFLLGGTRKRRQTTNELIALH